LIFRNKFFKIEYQLKKENRAFYNGVNYRLYVLAAEEGRWVIVEEAPVHRMVEAGYGFGTPEEKIASSKSNRSSKLKPTVFNDAKDVWGWTSGKYIVLHWNPYSFAFFNVYRKTNYDTCWNLVNLKPLEKPEFFDSDIYEYSEIAYKIEAVNKKGRALKFYSPVFLKNCNHHQPHR